MDPFENWLTWYKALAAVQSESNGSGYASEMDIERTNVMNTHLGGPVRFLYDHAMLDGMKL